ncbi:Ig-like domain-containing protein [Plantibacter sp. RU18]|uniref:Ig-like domain-containing protein n=1 Tax=Plantibacter sp. RU18 TaxID=3158143 RepID=UPI003D365A0E
MSNWSGWLRKRKTAASITALSVLVAVPVTAALIHQGFPVTEVDLESRDVWVTNGESLLAGRLNDQISELDGAVSTASNNADVLQNGDDVFLQDKALSSLERIDPAFTSLIQRVSLPTGATVRYGGDRLSVVAGETGKLWSVDAAGELRFDPTETKPIISIGKAGQAVVTSTGTILAVAPAKQLLYRIMPDGTKTESKLPKLDEYQLSAAGEQAVILDLSRGELVKQDGSTTELPGEPLKIQEPSAADDSAVIATGDSLVRVPLGGGDPVVLDADVLTAATSAAEVTAPVYLDGCMHGAWASSSRYAAECADKKPIIADINPETIGQQLVFRVNRSVIALNNIQTGNSWLVQANMRLVDNWDEVTPPQEEDGEEGDEKASEQSFEDTLAERTEENRPPIARDDTFGVRPGRATVLPLLDNDSDPDGDVLTIQNHSDVATESGTLEYIDGGRALQFTPAEGFVAGTTSFRYSVSDSSTSGSWRHPSSAPCRWMWSRRPMPSRRSAGLSSPMSSPSPRARTSCARSPAPTTSPSARATGTPRRRRRPRLRASGRRRRRPPWRSHSPMPARPPSRRLSTPTSTVAAPRPTSRQRVARSRSAMTRATRRRVSRGSSTRVRPSRSASSRAAVGASTRRPSVACR